MARKILSHTSTPNSTRLYQLCLKKAGHGGAGVKGRILCWRPLFLLFSVGDVDLAFLRSREDVTHDRKAFSNDSEWELLSVSSAYSILQSSAGDFAQIQFHVGPSLPVAAAPFSALFGLLCWAERSLLCCLFSLIIIREQPIQPAPDVHWLSAFQRPAGQAQTLGSCCSHSPREYKESGFQRHGQRHEPPQQALRPVSSHQHRHLRPTERNQRKPTHNNQLGERVPFQRYCPVFSGVNY